MNNKMIKNILILSIALFTIMLISTLIVVGFNSIIGFSTDVANDDVATSISAVAFAIAIILKLIYDKKSEIE